MPFPTENVRPPTVFFFTSVRPGGPKRIVANPKAWDERILFTHLGFTNYRSGR